MIRKGIIYTLSLFVLTVVLGAIQEMPNEAEQNEYDIAFYDGTESETAGSRRKLSAVTTEESLILDTEKDAYVLNEESFQKLNVENAEEYLSEGGIIIVNDNNVTGEDLRTKIATKTADFDYSEEDDFYGFYVFNNGQENVVVNVALGYLSEVEDDEVVTEKVVSNEIEKETLANTVVKSAVSRQTLDSNLSLASTGGSVGSTDTSGQIIATAYLENILYLESNKQRACSYTIYTNVVDVAKVRNASGKIQGIYDVTSTFTVDAESKFAITDYGVRMQNFHTILDASYLNSNTSTTVTLGGSLGFQGEVINGSINAGVSYTYTPDSQEITNNFPVGSEKYWNSDVVKEVYDASRKLKPSIRILNNNDSNSTYEYSRVESFKIKDNGWWIFKNYYYMMDKYRKELGICWNANGFVRQVTYTG